MKNFLLAMVLMFSLISKASAENLLIVGENEVTDAIKKEFVEQGQDEKLDLEFFGGQTIFHIKDAKTAKILVSGLKIDELQNKFFCNMEIFADGKAYAKTDIQGRYYVIGQVYVPAKNIQKGEIITPEMLKVISVRMNRIKPSFVVEKEKLVNKEAKKVLSEGKIVTHRDIGVKMLIKKGDVVTAVYKTDKMQITAKAEALGEGAKGDKIELLNQKSKKVLYGEVVDQDTVVIEGQ